MVIQQLKPAALQTKRVLKNDMAHIGLLTQIMDASNPLALIEAILDKNHSLRFM